MLIFNNLRDRPHRHSGRAIFSRNDFRLGLTVWIHGGAKKNWPLSRLLLTARKEPAPLTLQLANHA